MSHRLSPWAALLAGALTLLFAPDCTSELSPLGAGGGGQGGGSGGAPESTPAGVVLWASTWTLSWDEGRTVPLLQGGWSVETDLGYEVELRRGWIVDHSVSFGPCEIPASDGSSSWFPLAFGIREAFAHDSADPSAVEANHVEDLAHPVESAPLQSIFAKTRYCRAHWLVARATGPINGPGAVGMDGRSVRVEGSFRRGRDAGDFAIDTWWPHGHLDDLDAITDPEQLEAARADGEARLASVTVRRKLGGLFDGIDFASASDDQIAGLFLDNLAGQTKLRVELRR